RVDDDQGGDAEHDADDADERQVAGLEVPDAEEQLVHGAGSLCGRARTPGAAARRTRGRGCSKIGGRGKGEVPGAVLYPEGVVFQSPGSRSAPRVVWVHVDAAGAADLAPGCAGR